jgi:dihydropteroate synthase
MELRTVLKTANPRVVAYMSGGAVETEMERAGVHPEGVRIMAARAEFLVLRLDGIETRLAQVIKQIMLRTGSDSALEESAWALSEATTPVVVMGTRRQVKDLIRELAGQGGDAALISEAIAATLDDYARRSFVLKTSRGEIRLGDGPPAIMGILNCTPDSFSDGGMYLDPAAAIAHGIELAKDGARIIDVGGESTRPGSQPVDPEEKKKRVLPVIEALAGEVDCQISIDTSSAEVAEAALDAGATIINDITAMAGDARMPELAAGRRCPVILMHMKGTPRTMQKAPFYRDVMGEITSFLREAIDHAVQAGVDREQTVIDPGIGFGKTVEHNLEIIQRLKVLASLGRPILVGPSRKSFIGKVTDAPAGARDVGTAAAAALATITGAHIIRVHDLKESRQAALLAHAISTGRPGA